MKELQKNNQKGTANIADSRVSPDVFNLLKYLKNKGFQRLNRNQSHSSDCKHKYKFIHPDSMIRIVVWDDELMSVGNNSAEFVIPQSESEFLTVLKDVDSTLLSFLNNR